MHPISVDEAAGEVEMRVSQAEPINGAVPRRYKQALVVQNSTVDGVTIVEIEPVTADALVVPLSDSTESEEVITYPRQIEI
jgi:ABC-type lipoprotein release transport system permease subunit